MPKKSFKFGLNLKIILGVVAVIIVGGLVFLFSFTYSVKGKITDILNNEPIAKATLSLGDKIAKSNSEGDFAFEGLKLWERKSIQIESPSEFEEYNQDIMPAYSFTKRAIEQNIELCPTAKTTSIRLDGFEQHQQWAEMYDLLHPDTQKLVTKKQFVAYYKKLQKWLDDNSIEVSDFKTGDVKMLKKWKDSTTKKTYTDVAELQHSYKISFLGFRHTDGDVMHLAKADGFWRWFRGNINDIKNNKMPSM
jgi:hypothetical protein